MSGRQMISFDGEGGRFNLRVAGVVVQDGHVLLHRAVSDPFWALPGGRVEMLETATEALCREMQEELLIDVEAGRLLWVVENYFTYGARRFHEIGLYFLMSLRDPAAYPLGPEPWDGQEDGGTPLVFQWFPLEELAGVDVRPSFLVDVLAKLPDAPVHLVHRGV